MAASKSGCDYRVWRASYHTYTLAYHDASSNTAICCEMEAAFQQTVSLLICSTRPARETPSTEQQRQQQPQLLHLLSTNAQRYHTTNVMSTTCTLSRRDFRAAHISTRLESSTPPRLIWINGAPQPRLCQSECCVFRSQPPLRYQRQPHS
jgi:hypothetical protein